jgi:hypothetical protein
MAARDEHRLGNEPVTDEFAEAGAGISNYQEEFFFIIKTLGKLTSRSGLLARGSRP